MWVIKVKNKEYKSITDSNILISILNRIMVKDFSMLDI